MFYYLTVIPKLVWGIQSLDLRMDSKWQTLVGGLWSDVIRKISNNIVILSFYWITVHRSFSLTCQLVIIWWTSQKRWAEDWVRSIERTLTEAPGGELCDSNKRFDSFAPVRSGRAKWFVDGCDYLACVAEAIDKVRCRWNKITFIKSYIQNS